MALAYFVMHHSSQHWWPYKIIDIMDAELLSHPITYEKVSISKYHQVPEERISCITLRLIKRDKKRHGILP